MAYVAPSTRSTGDLITAAIWNQDAVDNVIAVKAIADGASEIYIPITQDDTGTGLTNKGDFPGGDGVTGADVSRVSFRCPDNFSSITTAVIMVIPEDTQGAANWDITSDYGAVGEAFTTHSESDAATTYNVTADQIFEVDVSGILTSLAAGDYVGLGISNIGGAAHQVTFIGFFMKYVGV